MPFARVPVLSILVVDFLTLALLVRDTVKAMVSILVV